MARLQAFIGRVFLTRQNINSGTSSTVGGGNYLVQFDFSVAPSAYSLTLPPSPFDQDVVNIQTGRTLPVGNVEILALTFVANSGQNLNFNNVILLDVGDSIGLRWNASGAFWDIAFRNNN